jgi:apolipoprotein N-acyltransferase
MPRLVVWPENAVGFVVDANSLPLESAADALGHRVRLILGAPRSVVDSDGHATFRNTALLVSEAGEILRGDLSRSRARSRR